MRSTPWGDLEVRDAHIHFFSHRFFSSLATESRRTVDEIGAALGWEMPAAEPERLADRWARELDRHGVGQAAVIASVHGDEGSVAAAVARCPDRFFGYFMLNPCARDAAERASKVLDTGLRAVCFFPAMHRYSMDDERADAILRLIAAKPGTCAFVHCGVLTVGVRNKLGLPSPFDMRLSNPIGLHPVALRYPTINFVVPSFGAGYFREALMLADLCPNVYLDTASSNSWMRYEGMTLSGVFRRSLDVVGERRLLFGTDSSFFPRGWQQQIFDVQVAALAEAGVSEQAARAIFGGNLARLYDNGSLAADQR